MSLKYGHVLPEAEDMRLAAKGVTAAAVAACVAADLLVSETVEPMAAATAGRLLGAAVCLAAIAWCLVTTAVD